MLQVGSYLFGCLRMVGSVYRHVDIVHLHGDGKAEQYDLHDGHHDNDEHRAAVAQNLQRFFLYEYKKSVHSGQFLFAVSAKVRNTSSTVLTL